MSPFIRPAIVRRGDRLCSQAVIYILLGVFLLTALGSPRGPKVEAAFQSARSLARAGSLALGDTPEAAELAQAGVWVKARDAEFVCKTEPGQILLSVPFYALGTLLDWIWPGVERASEAHQGQPVQESEYLAHLAVAGRDLVWTALIGGLLVLCTRRLGVARDRAWLTGLTFGLCTFAWPEARSQESYTQTAFCLFLSFHLLVRANERFERLLRPVKLELIGLGTVLGLALITRPDSAPAVVCLFITTIVVIFRGYRRLAQFALFLRQTWRRRHWVDLAWMGTPLLIVVSSGMVMNWLRFESVLAPSGRWPERAPSFAVLFEEFAAQWIAPSGGLLWVAPLLLILPLGLRHLMRGRRIETIWPVTCVLIVLAIQVSAVIPSHHDDWSFGPAKLLPALPFLWIGVGFALEGVRNFWMARQISWCLILAGAVVNIAGVFVNTRTHRDLTMEAWDLLQVQAAQSQAEAEAKALSLELAGEPLPLSAELASEDPLSALGNSMTEDATQLDQALGRESGRATFGNDAEVASKQESASFEGPEFDGIEYIATTDVEGQGAAIEDVSSEPESDASAQDLAPKFEWDDSKPLAGAAQSPESEPVDPPAVESPEVEATGLRVSELAEGSTDESQVSATAEPSVHRVQRATRWELRFAQPWSHWRILRHRSAGLGESFPVRSIFFVNSDKKIEAGPDTPIGMRHISWIDAGDRLGLSSLPALLLSGFFVSIGLIYALRGLSRSQP